MTRMTTIASMITAVSLLAIHPEAGAALRVRVQAEPSAGLVILTADDPTWKEASSGKIPERVVRTAGTVAQLGNAGGIALPLGVFAGKELKLLAFIDANQDGHLNFGPDGAPKERFVTFPASGSFAEFIDAPAVPPDWMPDPVVIDLRPRVHLTVNVLAKPGQGAVYLSLADEDGYKNNGGVNEQDSLNPGAKGLAKAEFEVPPGRYCIRAFQDRNGNEELDFNLFGKPKEPFAMHRAPARLKRNQPFADLAFPLSGASETVTLRLD